MHISISYVRPHEMSWIKELGKMKKEDMQEKFANPSKVQTLLSGLMNKVEE